MARGRQSHDFAGNKWRGLVGGWVEVEKGKYRYAVDWSRGIRVCTVIWEYLATETYWAC